MKTIVTIQVLRFVAAAMVLVSHVQHEILNRPSFKKSSFEPIEPVVWAGSLIIEYHPLRGGTYTLTIGTSTAPIDISPKTKR